MSSPTPTGKSLQRLDAFPIDKDEVQPDLASAEALAASPTGFLGLLLTLKDAEGRRRVAVVQDDRTVLLAALSGDLSGLATETFVGDSIAALGTLFTLKGTVPGMSDLPLTDNKSGDVWLVGAAGTNLKEVVWVVPTIGDPGWEPFGEVAQLDLAVYATVEALSDETDARTIAVQALQSELSTETSARIADIAAVTETISDEVEVRETETAALGGRLTAEETARAALSASVNQLDTKTTTVISRLDNLAATSISSVNPGTDATIPLQDTLDYIYDSATTPVSDLVFLEQPQTSVVPTPGESLSANKTVFNRTPVLGDSVVCCLQGADTELGRYWIATLVVTDVLVDSATLTIHLTNEVIGSVDTSNFVTLNTPQTITGVKNVTEITSSATAASPHGDSFTETTTLAHNVGLSSSKDSRPAVGRRNITSIVTRSGVTEYLYHVPGLDADNPSTYAGYKQDYTGIRSLSRYAETYPGSGEYQSFDASGPFMLGVSGVYGKGTILGDQSALPDEGASLAGQIVVTPPATNTDPVRTQYAIEKQANGLWFNAKIEPGTRKVVHINSLATTVLDLNVTRRFDITMLNDTTISFANASPLSGQEYEFEVRLIQPGTVRIPTWPQDIVWLTGVPEMAVATYYCFVFRASWINGVVRFIGNFAYEVPL